MRPKQMHLMDAMHLYAPSGLQGQALGTLGFREP